MSSLGHHVSSVLGAAIVFDVTKLRNLEKTLKKRIKDIEKKLKSAKKDNTLSEAEMYELTDELAELKEKVKEEKA